MRVDIGNALADVATPGVPEDALARLDERVADAHEHIERGRANGEFGYAALDLPETADVAAVEAATEGFDPEAVLVVGIGGSALGAATLSAALGDDAPELYVLDNVDPAHVSRILGSVPLAETAVNVVSRSGTTAETLANFLVVREAFEAQGVDWTDRTVVTTGESGPLRDLADAEGLPSVPVPERVPGRFAALSTIGLVPVSLQGHDVRAVLAGGREGMDSLAGSLYDCPAYAYGAVSYALEQRGVTTTAMMPYAESLEYFAEWFAQLWAESLGKDGLGQTPARALGATDQHSQLQLYRAGRRDRQVTLVRPTDREDRAVPATDSPELSYLGGTGLGELLDAEFVATEASLAEAGQPNVRVEIDRVDGRGIGDLLYGMEAACILAGELLSVETFTQPAVEWGKRATRGLLGDESQDVDIVAEKRELVVD